MTRSSSKRVLSRSAIRVRWEVVNDLIANNPAQKQTQADEGKQKSSLVSCGTGNESLKGQAITNAQSVLKDKLS